MAWEKSALTTNNCAADLSDRLKALVGGSGVANWKFVENVPAGTGAGQSGSTSYSVDVFKCAGNGTNANSAGIDFYVAIARPVSSPNNGFTLWTFELYSPIANASNKGMTARPTGQSNAPVTVPDTTDYSFDSSAGTPTYRTFEARKSYGSYWGATLTNSGFSYFIKVHKDFLIMSVLYGGTAYSFYAGLMQSALTNISDPMPLVLFGISGSNVARGVMNVSVYSPSVSRGAFSRLPGVTSASISAAGLTNLANNGVWCCASSPVLNGNLQNGGNTSGANDLWLSNLDVACRVAVTHRMVAPGNATWPGYVGYLRGFLPADVLALYDYAGHSWADTTTIDGVSDWTALTPTSSYTDIGGTSLFPFVRAV
jgi:hypothetical protein